MASSKSTSLSEEEVRSIFRNLCDSQSPCSLQYRAFSSGPKRCFQPPSYAFQEGIYILCNLSRPDLPRHLRAKVMSAAQLGYCKWKMSGPCIASPTDLQKRFCGPECGGNNNRCDMWTMVINGEENLDYRLLHVRPLAGCKTPSRKQNGHVAGGCRKCGKDDDYPLLMECSFCTSDHCHTYCAGFASVPNNDWFCSEECMKQHELLRKLDPEGSPTQGLDARRLELEQENDSKKTADNAQSLRMSEVVASLTGGGSMLAENRFEAVSGTVNAEATLPARWRGALRMSEFSPAADDDRKRPAKDAVEAEPKRSRTTQESSGPQPEPAATQPSATNSAGNPFISESDIEVETQGEDEPKQAEAEEQPNEGSAGHPIVLDNADDVLINAEEASASVEASAEDQTEVYYTLSRIELGSDETEALGFIPAPRSATFADLRSIVQNQLNLPENDAWDFSLLSLGPVNASQERILGSVAERLEQSGDPAIGDGSFGDPFRLNILL